MLKFLKSIFIVILSIVLFLPLDISAIDQGSDEYFGFTEMQHEDNQPRVTGLISVYGITLKKDGSRLLISAMVSGGKDVVKCGFKDIKIQRRGTSSSSWSDYATLNDSYADSNTHVLTSEMSISTSYQYRAVCTFYAKRNILLVEKIDGVSNIV